MKHTTIFLVLISVLFYSCKENEQSSNKPKTGSRKQISEIQKTIVDSELLKTWIHFREIVAKENYSDLKKISLAEVHASDSVVSVEKFATDYCDRIFDKALSKKIKDTLYSDYVTSEMKLGYFSKSEIEKIYTKNGIGKIEEFQILKAIDGDCGWTYLFQFVKTKDGFKFYGCDAVCGPLCSN